MSLALTQSFTAVGANITSSFLGVGGVPIYTYSVLPGGAGGTINATTGVYTAPALASSSPNFAYDTIQVQDSLSATARSQILVGTPLMLFCDIIQKGMGLANGRVYAWEQKIFEPTDYDLYVAVSIPLCKPFSNISAISEINGIFTETQSVNMLAQIDIDIISRGPAARDQKELVILSLRSNYCEQQQEANSFFIGRVSSNFINLSNVDASAIPYRYRISCQMQYFVNKAQPIPYYSSFSGPSVLTN